MAPYPNYYIIKGVSSPRGPMCRILVWTCLLAILFLLHHDRKREFNVMASTTTSMMMNNSNVLPLQFRSVIYAGGVLSPENEEGTNSVIGKPLSMSISFPWNNTNLLTQEEEITVLDSASWIVKKLLLTLDQETNQMKASRVKTIVGSNILSSDSTDALGNTVEAQFVVASKKSDEIYLLQYYSNILYRVKNGNMKKLLTFYQYYSGGCTQISDGVLTITETIIGMFTILEGREEYLYIVLENGETGKIHLPTLKIEYIVGCEDYPRSVLSLVVSAAVNKVMGELSIIAASSNGLYKFSNDSDNSILNSHWKLLVGNATILRDRPVKDFSISPKKILLTLEGDIIVLEESNRIISIDKWNNVNIICSSSDLIGLEISSMTQSYLTGELFISDYNNNVIRKIGRDGSVSTVFGNGAKYYFGTKVPASKSRLQVQTFQVSTHIESDIISFVDTLDNIKIRVIDEDAEISTLFDKEFIESETSTPEGKVLGVFRARYGQLYISVKDHIYKVYDRNKFKRVVGLKEHFSGDGGIATQAVLSEPTGIHYSKSLQALYIADSINNRIRVVKNGIISTIYEGKHQIVSLTEKDGNLYFFEDSYLKILNLKTETVEKSKLLENAIYVTKVYVHDNGDIYVCNLQSLWVLKANGNQLKKIDSSEYSTSIGFLSNGDAIIAAKYKQAVHLRRANGDWEELIRIPFPTDVLISSRDEIYIAHDRYISKLVNGKLERIVGSSLPTHTFSDPLETRFLTINSLSFGDSEDEIYFTESTRFVWKLKGKTLTKVAGGLGDGLQATEAKIHLVSSFHVNVEGEVVIADAGNHVIRKVEKNGIISSMYGIPGVYGYNEETDASKALFNTPKQIHYTDSGVLYVYDSKNNIIRRIKDGKIKTIVGIPKQRGREEVRGGKRGNETSLIEPVTFSISPKGDHIIFSSGVNILKLKLGSEDNLVELVYSTRAVTTSIGLSTDGLSFYLVDTNTFIQKILPYCPDGYRISYKNHLCIIDEDEPIDNSYAYFLPLSGIVLLSGLIFVFVLFALIYHMRKNNNSQVREAKEQQAYNFLSEDEEELQSTPQQTNQSDQEHNLIQLDP